MTKTLRVIDYDIIYLSYDEPNAEKNYADLCSKVPWAKRIHGVKGSDAAHKACAEISETDHFITVDGDNIIDSDFLQQEVSLNNNENLSHCVISWAANNQINGLIYGNGGLKCWPKKYVLNMRTHEAADPNNKHAQVDFCWDIRYIQVERCFSKIMNNASPRQAWRAGFREGVKMCLNRGERPEKVEDFFQNDWRNLHRAYIWMTVGADADNGLWAIYGARLGFYKTMFTDWDFVNVRDFDYLNNYWDETVKNVSEENLHEEVEKLGNLIKSRIDIPIPVKPLDEEASNFYKYTYQSPARLKPGFLKN
jgi:hypothetical protein